MKFREFLPNYLLSETKNIGVGRLLGIPDKEMEPVQFHLDRMGDEWDTLLSNHSITRSRFNYIAHCFFYLEICEQEFTPRQIMAMAILIGIYGVQIEDVANGKDNLLANLPALLSPVTDSRMECGSHYGYLTDAMYNIALAQRKVGSGIGLGRRVNDDTLIRLMARTAHSIVGIGPMTQSDMARVAYSMGIINSCLSYTQFSNVANMPMPGN
jgi:hypothetical protein